MGVEVVEVFQAFEIRKQIVPVGARVWAWKRSDGVWIVTFNGTDLAVEAGSVGPIGSGPTQKEAPAVYSSARLEQYQLAPSKPH